jgi:hypothetical protein
VTPVSHAARGGLIDQVIDVPAKTLESDAWTPYERRDCDVGSNERSPRSESARPPAHRSA